MGNRGNLFGWIKALLVRPSTRFGAGILVLIGLGLGIVGSAGFITVVEHTNSLEFCSSCHAMKEFAYAEYTTTPHFSNRSGVQAICSDCHVPQAFIPKMAAKIRATYVELPRHYLGMLDTEEQFEARREALANRVWDRMRANDSRECRNCHEWDRMAMELQRTAARREHEDGRAEGKTCIDCHQGIAHTLPASMLQPEDEEIDWDFGGGSR